MKCRWCWCETRITNDLGDERCSGCGRDWSPVTHRAAIVEPRAPETFREVPPASPLAALKGAVGRLEVATRDTLRFRYNAQTGDYDPPTPAAMLDEALGASVAAMRTAKSAIAAMGLSHTSLARRADVAWIRVHEVLEEIKREAETRHGR